MEYVSGNIYLRAPTALMARDETVLGHRHNFDHTTFCDRGSLEVSLLHVTKPDAAGRPIDAEIEKQWVLRATDDINWCLILKGRFHMLRALEDGTRYRCIYAHQAPQAITYHAPGGRVDPALTMRDESGQLWVRVNEKIVQVTSEWADAYR